MSAKAKLAAAAAPTGGAARRRRGCATRRGVAVQAVAAKMAILPKAVTRQAAAWAPEAATV